MSESSETPEPIRRTSTESKATRILDIRDLFTPEQLRKLSGVDLLQLISDRDQMWKKAHTQALKDELTGMETRKSADPHILRMLEAAKTLGVSVSFLFLDVDHFKQVNDTYGHAAGDKVLQAVAHALSTAIRDTDLLKTTSTEYPENGDLKEGVYRYGGEEFLVALPNASEQNLTTIAERFRETISGLEIPVNGTTINITMSLGGSTFNPRNQEDNKLIEELRKKLVEVREGRAVSFEEAAFQFKRDQADFGLYTAKRTGRNRYVFMNTPLPDKPTS